ncbi:hypothetical protein [Cognatiyoonia sp. IB215182]|uniref:hypothetical protein n=1 Tax=Cognatiyoonia sp. IB215182 TaxID=3097353 RepID=UPI002A10E7A0|nr:hypothetical protein [Cognatiyoonia sp. IB215182]MDX8354211.1 hypothetical protein [Cognatiyoonia sp. IB215182]
MLKGNEDNMMVSRTRRTAADDAAEAFYGQNEQAFMEQVRQICSADPRLIKVFKMTRDTYQQATRPN